MGSSAEHLVKNKTTTKAMWRLTDVCEIMTMGSEGSAVVSISVWLFYGTVGN